MTNWNRKSVWIGACAVALAFMLTGSVGAFSNHQNTLTFSRALALPGGVVLEADTYLFDVEYEISPDVVVVYNRTRQKMFYRGVTAPTVRPQSVSPNTAIVISEAPRKQTPPIATWYEVGSVNGHEFKY